MASIRFGSELMTNYVAAVAVPSASHLVTCLDDVSLQTIVFALSNDPVPKLQVIKTNGEGRRLLIDLGGILHVPAGKSIETFDAQQAKDLKIYLSFATKEDDRTSKLWVVEPFLPSGIESIKALPPTELGLVHKITVGLADAPNQDHPTIWVRQQPVNRSAKGDDIGRVEVLLKSKSLKVWKDMTVPTNTTKIIDIAPAIGGRLGEGLIFLVEQGNQTKLYAKFLAAPEEENDAPRAANFEIPCPKGPLSLATFTDFSDSFHRSTILLGSDDGLYTFASDTIGTQTPPSFIREAPQFAGARNLFVSQDGKELSVWATNSTEQLVYLSTDIDNFSGKRGAVLMDSATSFSAVISQRDRLANTKQMLIVNDSQGSLSLLEQSLDTGVWRKTSFYVEDSANIFEVPSYTVSVTALDSQGIPLSNGQVFVQSASIISATVNGKLETLDPRGRWYSLDVSGELAFIVPVNGVSTQPLSVTKLRNSSKEELTIHTTKIDPSEKVIKGFAALTSKTALETATTTDKKSLWEGKTKPSDKDLETAAKCFAAISDAYTNLPRDGSVVRRAVSSSRQLKASTASVADTIASVFMDGFNWVKARVHEAVDWIVRKAGEVWEFVCDIGNTTKKFVLDCVEKVAEAASWVWDKLKLGWKTLCNYIGFVFNWGDILETKDTIKGLLNAGCDYAQYEVHNFQGKIDRFFTDMQADIAALIDVATGGKQTFDSSKATEDKEMKDYSESPATKWIGERMKNNSGSASAKRVDSQDPEAANLWNDNVEPLIGSFTKTVEDLATNISKLFKGNNNLSMQQLLGQIAGSFIVDVLEVVKQILKLVIALVAKLIGMIKKLGNQRLSWGFLNTLWRWLTNGSELTIFDAISLIVAIPSTIIIKLVTGRKPPNLGTINREMFSSVTLAALKDEKDDKSEHKTETGGAVVPKSLKRDMTVILLGCSCGAAVVKLYLDDIQLVMMSVESGIRGAVDSLNPAAVVEVMTMCIDAFNIYEDITNPPTDDVPGANLRKAATYVKCFRLALNALYMLAGKLGLHNSMAEKIKLSIDLLTVLVNCGLYAAVYVKEVDDTEWKDHDPDKTSVAAADTLMETVAGAGYFSAFFFKEKNPLVALVGLGVMQVAAVGAVAAKSCEFKLTWKKIEQD